MESKTIILKNKKYSNIEILKMLLFPLNINFNSIEDLYNIEICRDKLLNLEIKKIYLIKINNIKNLYKSSKLTSLHGNSNIKQKHPQINLLRQILKCNMIKMKPKIISLGYNKINGKKMIKRSYILEKIE